MSDDSNIHLSIDGKSYAVDLADLTIDETELLEDARDKPLGAFLESDLFRSSTLRALAFIALSRKKPGVSLADIGAMKLSRFRLGDSEAETEARPTRAASKAKPKAKAKDADGEGETPSE